MKSANKKSANKKSTNKKSTNKKSFTKQTIGATLINFKPGTVIKQNHRGSGDSLNQKKWGLPLKNVVPGTTVGSLINGCDKIFIGRDGNVINFTPNDIRFTWVDMIHQVEALLNSKDKRNLFKDDPESRDYMFYILRAFLKCDLIFGNDYDEGVGEFEITSANSNVSIKERVSDSVIWTIDLHKRLYTPYHVHYIVNWVVTYVKESVKKPDIILWFFGSLVDTFEGFPLF